MAAARRPPSSDQGKVQFFRPTATARSSRCQSAFDWGSDSFLMKFAGDCGS